MALHLNTEFKIDSKVCWDSRVIRRFSKGSVLRICGSLLDHGRIIGFSEDGKFAYISSDIDYGMYRVSLIRLNHDLEEWDKY